MIACLPQAHRVQLVPPKTESVEARRRRLLAGCEDIELMLLLRIRNADDMKLMWTHKDAAKRVEARSVRDRV